MTINKEVFPHPWSVHNYLLRIRGGEPMYMESGVLDLFNYAPLNENTYKPADLHYDDTLGPYSNTDTALMGEIRVSRNSITYSPRDEGDSRSGVGCDADDLVDQIIMIDFVSSGDVEVATAASDVFCPDTQTIAISKRCQAFFPASLWSGKMRMFVQSIYGSKRTDYTMDVDADTRGGLTIDNVEFQPHDTGYALYTGSNYTYYVLKLTGTVSVSKLELSDQGEKLREWLIDNPQTAEETRRYEAYLLSTATFGDWENVGTISTPVGDRGPFGYDWHVNWGGDKAHIVLHQLKDGETNVWEFAHYSMTMSLFEAEENEFWLNENNWTFSITEEETGEATFRVGGDIIWSPDWFEGGMTLFVTQEDALDTPTHVDSDVPIYVVYNYDTDDFDVIRFKRLSLGTGDGVFTGNSIGYGDNLLPTGGSQCSNGCTAGSTVSGGSAIEVGFFVKDNEDFTSIGKDANVVSIRAIEYQKGESTEEVASSTSVAISNDVLCGSQPGSWDTRETIRWNAQGGVGDIIGSMGHGPMLVIPFYDCDAIYLGYTEGFSGDIDIQRVATDTTVYGSEKFYEGGSFVGEVEYKTDWDTSPGAALSTVHRLFTRSQQQGTYETGNAEDVQMNITEVQYYRDGEFVQAHEDNFIDDEALRDLMFLPACMLTHVPGFEEQMLDTSWQDGAYDTGGFEFGPVVFPIAENALPVVARRNLTDNFKATKNPGQNNFLTDDEYEYDQLSSHISYVGHD